MGKSVVVVQYGERNALLGEALRARGARVEELCLYEWLLPEDVGPLRALVKDVTGGRVDAVAFTSQVQARHLFQVAAGLGQAPELAAALNNHTVVASIGPTCTAALRRFGVEPQVVPEHPKMGHLIVALAQHQEEHGLRSGRLFATVA
ncbi:MAG: uroporphyrinogen-III synthase [Chloroflexi bacterium]|nr:uroporphyrinogen-III synthase [Chloroflexota bacterium]